MSRKVFRGESDFITIENSKLVSLFPPKPNTSHTFSHTGNTEIHRHEVKQWFSCPPWNCNFMELQIKVGYFPYLPLILQFQGDRLIGRSQNNAVFTDINCYSNLKQTISKLNSLVKLYLPHGQFLTITIIVVNIYLVAICIRPTNKHFAHIISFNFPRWEAFFSVFRNLRFVLRDRMKTIAFWTPIPRGQKQPLFLSSAIAVLSFMVATNHMQLSSTRYVANVVRN